MNSPRLDIRHVTKRYPSVVANDDVSLAVGPGEIHAILGENGAGKSTLMKIIYGAVKPDEGEVLFDGKPCKIRNPQEARALGISMVFQHFSLFETVTVAENIWLGLDKSLSLATVRERTVQKAQEYGLDVEPDRPVHSLSVGERQRVEIVRALLTDPKVLILDEPTSVLTPQAVRRLFVTLRKRAENGCSVLYISHKLDEIRELCTNCTVLRGGKVTGNVDPRNESNASLSRLMIGAEPPKLQHREQQAGAVAFAASGLTRQMIRLVCRLNALRSRCARAKSLALLACRATDNRNFWLLSQAKARALQRAASRCSVTIFPNAIHAFGVRAGCILFPKNDWVAARCPRCR